MKKLIASLVLIGHVSISFGAGIPVFDATSLVQALAQVQELKNQVQQQKQLYGSLNGSRGMGELLNNPALRDYLPQDFKKVYDNVNSPNYGGLTGPANDIRKANQLFDCAKLVASSSRQLCQRNGGIAANHKAFAMNAYEQSAKRVDQIESLMKEINNTTDAKSIAELNARLQAENALIQNEQIKLQMFSELQRAEENLIKQQMREKAIADSRRTKGTTFHLKEY